MFTQMAFAAGTIFVASVRPAPVLSNAFEIPNDSTRTWLAAELRRMPGIVTLAGCRVDFPGGTPKAPWAPGASKASSPTEASGPVWHDLPLVSLRASAEGLYVRLIASDSALRVTDNPEVAGVARRLFNAGGLMLKASSKESAARVASELSSLAAECAKAK